MIFNPLPKDITMALLDQRPKDFTLTSEEGRVLLKNLIYHSDEHFFDLVLKHWKTDQKTGLVSESGKLHRELWQAFDDPSHKVIIVPRNFAKSTNISKFKVLKALLFGTEKEILLVSSQGLGEQIIGAIKQELESNPVLLLLFGRQVPESNLKEGQSKAKWRQKELELENGSKVYTRSKGQSIRGMRPLLIIADDPEETADTRNPIQVAKFQTWFWSSLFPTLPPGGKCLVVGTMISENCLVNTIKQSADTRGFKVIEYQCMVWPKAPKPLSEETLELWFDNAESLWPEYWSIAKLKQRLNEVGRKHFLQEYCNIPQIESGSPVFDLSIPYQVVKPIKEVNNIQWYAEPKDKVLFLGVDTAGGGATGDYSVIMMRDKDHNLVAQYRAHIPPEQLADIVDLLIKNGTVGCVCPEINNHGFAFLVAARKKKWSSSIYRKSSLDKITNKMSQTLGWNTNAKTKPEMISHLREVFGQGNVQVSEAEYQEIEKYYHDEKGGMNAVAPYHDDTIIADALCMQAIKDGARVKFFAGSL